MGADPLAITITPNGRTVYVVNAPISAGAAKGSVTPIRVATNHRRKAITVGRDPNGILITPDGRTAYVSNLVAG